MPDTFPDIQVDYGGGKKSAPKVANYGFGDNYVQRVGLGLNNKLKSWPVKFSRENSVIQQIDDFLELKGATESFLWTPPPYFDSTTGAALPQVLVVCQSWDATYPTGLTSTLSGTFNEVADI